jgi:two-component system, sensor histidine kinase PhcS
MPFVPQEFSSAWQEYDRETTIRKTRLGCIFGIVMVPLFTLLDHYVYQQQTMEFFIVRLLCSALMTVLYFVLGTEFGHKHYHLQGIVLLFLPSATIAWMIYREEGSASPYYAGLILVLMVLAVVLDWTFWQSVVCVALVLALYVAASIFSSSQFDSHRFISNCFFLVSSSIAIIAGTYYHSGVRVREFISRCELDKSSKALAASLQQLKENEIQLLQSEKLASLGRMSAGIIHEINNPLNFATTGMFMLRKKSKYIAPEQLAEYEEVVSDVEKGLKRVQTIVTDLRGFTHPESDLPESVDVAETMNASLRFLTTEWKDKVKIENKIVPGQIVQANRNKLVHILVNLVQNSLDALRYKKFEGGEEPTIWIEGRVEDGLSFIIVRDNGTGIEQKNLAKIFDPFFTTKDVGEGMGMGLSICHRIVRGYGGHINVRTEPGRFCEFILDFPEKRARKAENIAGPGVPPVPAGTTGVASVAHLAKK